MPSARRSHARRRGQSIADKATALAAYARQAKNVELEIQSAEIRARAKRRMGEISAAMETAQGRRQGSKHSNNGVTKLEALEAAGVSKMEACRCEKLAAIPRADFEARVAAFRDAGKAVTAENAHNTGETEWYTPQDIFEAARGCMGGSRTPIRF